MFNCVWTLISSFTYTDVAKRRYTYIHLIPIDWESENLFLGMITFCASGNTPEKTNKQYAVYDSAANRMM